MNAILPMSEFLKRRAKQLAEEGLKLPDTRTSAGKLRTQDGQPTADIPRIGPAARSDVDTSRGEKEVPLHEAISFIHDTLLRFAYRPSDATRATTERTVADMSDDECEAAIRLATAEGIQKKPAYYFALLSRVQKDTKFFYRDLARGVEELQDLFERYHPQGAHGSLAERETVEAMTPAELRRELNLVSAEVVRARGGFYAELLRRLLFGK